MAGLDEPDELAELPELDEPGELDVVGVPQAAVRLAGRLLAPVGLMLMLTAVVVLVVSEGVALLLPDAVGVGDGVRVGVGDGVGSGDGLGWALLAPLGQVGDGDGWWVALLGADVLGCGATAGLVPPDGDWWPGPDRDGAAGEELGLPPVSSPMVVTVCRSCVSP